MGKVLVGIVGIHVLYYVILVAARLVLKQLNSLVIVEKKAQFEDALQNIFRVINNVNDF